MSATTKAMQLAERLDRTLTAGPDFLMEDVLTQIGMLLGGLSVKGFKADLTAELLRLEDEAFENAGPWDYSPGRGGNDPDAFVSDHLLAAIDAAEEAFCADFIRQAEALLKPFTHPALAEAA